jgi:hypothetical protein
VVVNPIVMDLTTPLGDPTATVSDPTSKGADDGRAAPEEPLRDRRASVRGPRSGVGDTAAPAGSANGGAKPRNKAPDRTNPNYVDFGI